MHKPSDNLTIRSQQPADLPAMRQLIEQAWESGELKGRSQRDIDRWIEGLPDDPDSAYVALAGDEVAGYVAVNAGAIIVAPRWRRRGIGRALVETALASEPDLEFSLPFENPGAEAFLLAIGFRFDYFLRQLRLDPSATPASPELPEGFQLRLYDDDLFDRYFQLVNQAFADHQPPIVVSESRMRAVHGRPDFDPSLVAVIARDEDPANLIAFTFLRTPALEEGMLRGSVGMIGVDRAYRRLGLGRQLLRWGVQRLRQLGCTEITLEVVDMNERALPLYLQEGFVPVRAWPYWSPPRPTLPS